MGRSVDGSGRKTRCDGCLDCTKQSTNATLLKVLAVHVHIPHPSSLLPPFPLGYLFACLSFAVSTALTPPLLIPSSAHRPLSNAYYSLLSCLVFCLLFSVYSDYINHSITIGISLWPDDRDTVT